MRVDISVRLSLPSLGSHTHSMTECSAKHNRGVTEVFMEAARASLNAKRVSGPYTQNSGDSGCVIA